MRKFFGILAFIALAACAAPAVMPQGEQLSMQKWLSDTRGKPYECIGYQAATDSCEGLAKRRVQGDRIFYDAVFLVVGPNAKAAQVNVAVDFKLEDTRYCGSMAGARISTKGNLSPAEKSLIEELLLAEMIMLGDICTIYVKDGQGRYLSASTDRAGRVQPDGVDPVWFFSGPKRLRAL